MNTANSSTKLLYFNPAHRRLLMPDWLNEIMKDTFVFLLFELVLGCEFCFDGRIAKMKQELAFLPGKNMLLMIYTMIENTAFDAPLQTGRRKYGMVRQRHGRVDDGKYAYPGKVETVENFGSVRVIHHLDFCLYQDLQD